MAPTSDWRDLFCGRATELDRLEEAYRAVHEGKGPRIAMLLGDRGMGKTRLAQELYRTLTLRYDPEVYWPDASLFRGKNLLPAPDLSDPSTLAHFREIQLHSRAMPFLWWGFRLSDPDDWNAVPADLTSHRRSLDLHLGHTEYARRLDEAKAKLKQTGRDIAKDATLWGIKEGAKLLVPGGPLLIEAFEQVESAYAHGDTAYTAVTAVERRRGLSSAYARADVAEIAELAQADLLDRTFAELSEVLRRAGERAGTPLVLFCDDAQFARAGADEGVLRLLTMLWQAAVGNRWRLLLVASHWAVDWTKGASEETPSFARTFAPIAARQEQGLVIELGKEPALAELVQSGLPGLPAGDVALLSAKADGNPRLLIELVERVRGRKVLRGANGALTPVAREEIEGHSGKLSALIRERLESDATPAEVRSAVAAASVQGMRLSCALAERFGEAIQLATMREGLAAAEQPHRLVAGVNTGVAEFVQRAYHEAARSLVRIELGDPSAMREALLRAALALFEDGPRFEALAREEQITALGAFVGMSADSADVQLHRQTGRCLLTLANLMLAGERGSDYAQAAHFAQRFAEGLGVRWSIGDYQLFEVHAALRALRVWSGAASAAPLAQALLQRARELAAAAGTPASLHDLSIALSDAGMAAQAQGKLVEAGELLREGLAVTRSLADSMGGALARRSLMRALHELGCLEEVRGNRSDANALYRESLALARELASPATEWARQDVCAALNSVGRLAIETGALAEADALLRESLALARELEREDPRARGDLSIAMSNVASIAEMRGNLAEAEALTRESLAIVRAIAEQLATPDARRDLMIGLNRAGVAAQRRGNWADAEALFGETLTLARELSEQLATPRALNDLGVALYFSGSLARSRDSWPQAAGFFQEAAQIAWALFQQSQTPLSRQNIIQAIEDLMSVRHMQGAPTELEQYYSQLNSAIASNPALRQGTPRDRQDAMRALNNLGALAERRGSWREAEELYRESLALALALHEQLGTPAMQHGIASCLDRLGQLAEAQGKWTQAAELHRQSLANARRLLEQLGTPEARGNLVVSLHAVARSEDLLGNWPRAEQLHREGLVNARAVAEVLATVDARRRVASSLHHLAVITGRLGNYAAAEGLHREALELVRDLARQTGLPGERIELAAALRRLGDDVQLRGDRAEAERLFGEAVSVTGSLARDAGTPEARRVHALCLSHAAAAARVRESSSDAEALCEQSLAILRTLAEQEPTAASLGDLVQALHAAGDAALAQDKPAEALAFFEEGVTAARRLAEQLSTPAARRALAAVLSGAAAALRVQERFAEAAAIGREALALQRALADELRAPEAQDEVLSSLIFLGELEHARHDLEGAESLFVESVFLARRSARDLDAPYRKRNLALALGRLGSIARAQAKDVDAESCFREALALSRTFAEQAGTPDALQALARALSDLAALSADKQDLAAGWDCAREALALRRELLQQAPSAVAQVELLRALQLASSIASSLRSPEAAVLRGELALLEGASQDAPAQAPLLQIIELSTQVLDCSDSDPDSAAAALRQAHALYLQHAPPGANITAGRAEFMLGVAEISLAYDTSNDLEAALWSAAELAERLRARFGAESDLGAYFTGQVDRLVDALKTDQAEG